MESVSIARLVLSIKELALKILINVNRAQRDTTVADLIKEMALGTLMAFRAKVALLIRLHAELEVISLVLASIRATSAQLEKCVQKLDYVYRTLHARLENTA